MREIIFRAIDSKLDKWVYGQFTRVKEGGCVCPSIAVEHEWDFGDYVDYPIINGETLGQYTGLHDMRKRKLYEGDIVECKENNYLNTFTPNCEPFKAKVMFEQGLFCVERLDNKRIDILANWNEDVELIGNVHENPELLEVDGK